MYQQWAGRQGGSFLTILSTLVSLESAFNAEQEHDIIFAVTCTTKEIKIQMKTILSHSRMTLICTRPVVCKGLRVYSCKPSLVMCALLTGCGFLIVMPRAEPRHTVCSRSVIMLRGGATVYSSWFVCLSDPAISSHSLKTKRWNKKYK